MTEVAKYLSYVITGTALFAVDNVGRMANAV